jgi:2'-5' RNA ligase
MTSYADYLFLLSPPENIKELIGKYKKASAKHIGEFKSRESPAHISAMHVERQKPYFADHTVVRMENTMNIMPPVLLHIDGFKYFFHLHGQYTIYAHIRITPAVDDWFTLLKKNLSLRKTLVPHITVVRNIPETDFNTLWPHFHRKKLVEPFWINELKIVRRETFNNFSKWTSFKSFTFNGLKGFKPNNDENQIDLF